MPKILSIATWVIVIAGIFLIAIIIQLRKWWKRRRGGTYTPPEIQKPYPTDPEVPQRKISEPQTPYFSNLELHGGQGKRRKSKPQIPYFSTPPPIPKLIPQPFDYQTEWWKELSRWYRHRKGWRCEECQISLRSDHYYLHTHHIRGTQYNKPKDLKALCLGCHAEHHWGLRETKDYKRFIEKYGRQWRTYRFE